MVCTVAGERSRRGGGLPRLSLEKGRVCWDPAAVSQTQSLQRWKTMQSQPPASQTKQGSTKEKINNHQFKRHNAVVSNSRNYVGYYSWHCTESSSCNVLHETFLLASCSRDLGCVGMLAKGYGTVILWQCDSSCCNICLVCYTHLPARRLAHRKDSFSTLSSFFGNCSSPYQMDSLHLPYFWGRIRHLSYKKAVINQWHVDI